MRSLTTEQAESLIFESYHRRQPLQGDDAQTRDLNPIQALYQRAGIDMGGTPTVTVAGSKGKGSTAILTGALLQGAGERVGLMTSPHYLSHRERIRLNGQSISENDFNRIMTQLAPHIRAISNRLKPTQYLSPNGLFMAVGMRYFSEQGATAIVIEAGRGGRFDEAHLFTNQVAIITRIDEEHQAQLGSTRARIAWHKAGIIQPTSTVITGAMTAEALQVIESEAQNLGCKHMKLHDDFSYRIVSAEDGLMVTIALPESPSTITCHMATMARYQGHNVALALMGVQALMPDVDWQEASAILPQVQLIGRGQKIGDDPVTFVDGAIHAQAAQAFLESVLPHSQEKRVLIGAYPADKDGHGVLQVFAPYVDQIILTQPEDGYLSYDGAILAEAQRTHPDALLIADVRDGLRYAIDYAKQHEAAVWAVGTQSLVRATLEVYGQDLTQIIRNSTHIPD